MGSLTYKLRGHVNPTDLVYVLNICKYFTINSTVIVIIVGTRSIRLECKVFTTIIVQLIHQGYFQGYELAVLTK